MTGRSAGEEAAAAPHPGGRHGKGRPRAGTSSPVEPRISILAYRRIGDYRSVRSDRGGFCHHRRFAAQMRFLAQRGYRVLSLEAALEGLAGTRPVPPRTVVLSFGEADEGFERYAWPELRRHGYPAILYVVAAEVAAEPPAVGGSLDRTPLGPERLRALRAAGLALGSQGLTRARLPGRPAAEIEAELAGSRRSLEDLLDAPVCHLAYPLGDHDLSTVEAAEKAGYASAVTLLRAAATPEFDPLALPRKAVSYGDSLLGFWWKLALKNEPHYPPARWREA